MTVAIKSKYRQRFCRARPAEAKCRLKGGLYVMSCQQPAAALLALGEKPERHGRPSRVALEHLVSRRRDMPQEAMRHRQAEKKTARPINSKRRCIASLAEIVNINVIAGESTTA